MYPDLPGTRSVLGRVISAEVRARMAARRISGKQLAALAGFSQNYLATRLRDEKPFTLDDVELLMEHIADDEDPGDFIKRAADNQSDGVWLAIDTAERESRTIGDDYTLAALDRDDSEALEANLIDP